MKALQTNALQINEFEAKVCTIAEYRRKKIVISCISAIVEDIEGYTVGVPRDIKLLSYGKMTKQMEFEAKLMFHKLRYTDLKKLWLL